MLHALNKENFKTSQNKIKRKFVYYFYKKYDYSLENWASYLGKPTLFRMNIIVR